MAVLPVLYLTALFTFYPIIRSASEDPHSPREEVTNLQKALAKAAQIFTAQQIENESIAKIEQMELIQENMDVFDRHCPDVEMFAIEAEAECAQYEDDMTDYIRNVSGIPKQPRHDSVQWYWAQESIWKKMPREFVCLETPEFQKVIRCLCQFCAWPFVVEDEKYDIYTKWSNEYDARDCKAWTNREFMRTGDSTCDWLNIPVLNKGQEIVKRLEEEQNAKLNAVAKPAKDNKSRETAKANPNKTSTSDASLSGPESDDVRAGSIHPSSLVSIVMAIVTSFMMLLSAIFFVANI